MVGDGSPALSDISIETILSSVFCKDGYSLSLAFLGEALVLVAMQEA